MRRTMVGMHTPRTGTLAPLDDFLPYRWRNPEHSDIDRALIDWAKKLGAS